MTKKDIKLSGMSFFIGLTMLLALAQAVAQPESIALDYDRGTSIGECQYATAPEIDRTPSIALYNGQWNTEVVAPENLTIPFYNQQLKIIVSQSESTFFFPCWGTIANDFGKKGKKLHYGIDVQLNEKAPVIASFGGMVRLVKQFEQYGKTVIIRHYNGLETVYSHLSEVIVCPNQPVHAGAVIGTGGQGENGTMHFETRFMYQPFNPLLFIDKDSHKLLGDTLTLTPDDMVPVTTPATVSNPTPKPANNTATTTSDGAYHIVKQGDTLYKISRMYNVSVEKILQLNHLRETDVISIGQKIRIK